jgi:Holliday junction resolvase-like predicted endonuclease
VFVSELRQANPRRQGDIGEATAIEWLVRNGYGVWLPVGHSPDVDLIAQRGDELIRVQVKTSACRRQRGFRVQLSTRGGNQSWSGTVKCFSAERCDFLFILVGGGRKWFIPAHAVEGTTGISLGGRKYAEFEVDSAPLPPDSTALESPFQPGGAPETGEPGRTVNSVAKA